jgi:hypothetical protein
MLAGRFNASAVSAASDVGPARSRSPPGEEFDKEMSVAADKEMSVATWSLMLHNRGRARDADGSRSR